MQYLILSLLSTLIGAVVGIGGGLILRPALGLMGVAKDLASFTSALTVFVMAVANLLSHKGRGTKIELKGTLPLAAGSIAGGYLGGALLPFVSGAAIQAAYVFVLILVLLAILLRPYLKPVKLERRWAQLAVGLLTGSLSGLFGIGGGPFQVAALVMFFNLPAKEAAVQSVLITLLTTMAALLSYAAEGYADFSLALYTAPVAVLGGALGGLLNRRLSDKAVSLIFCAVVGLMLLVQIVSLF